MKGEKLEITYINPSDLKAYGRNARTHEPEQVAQIVRSIERLGFANPVLVDENNEIIAGHGRTLAAIELGLTEVPVVVLRGLTATEKKALRLADNQIALTSGWDVDLLASEIAAIHAEDEDFGLDTLGFSDAEIDGYLAHAEALVASDSFDDEESDNGAGGALGGNGDDAIGYEAPEPPAEPKTRPGDVWTLGRHRLVCGDSTKPETFELLMRGEFADATITSPPYGAGDSAKLREHYVKGKEKLQTFYDEHEDSKSEWAGLMRDFFARCQEHSKCQFVNVQMLADNKRDLIDWLSENKGRFVDCIVWDKGHGDPQMQKNVLNNAYEFVFVFDNENASRAIPFAEFHGNYSNVLRISRGRNEYSDVHKAVYPVELPAAILDIAANAKTVIDPFGGTGTTLVACEQKGRNCRMIELSAAYCDIIIERWQSMTGGEAVRQDGVKFDDAVPN